MTERQCFEHNRFYNKLSAALERNGFFGDKYLSYSNKAAIMKFLHRNEARLHRLYTNDCNRFLNAHGDWDEKATIANEKAIESTEKKVKKYFEEYKIPIRFNRDPRGYAIQVYLSKNPDFNSASSYDAVTW